MVAFSMWIQSTSMPEFALALQKTTVSMFIAVTPYVIPTLQTIHIYAVSMLLVGFIMLNGRLFMVANRSRTLAQTMDRFMPWVWWCLLVLFITGALMAVGEPPRDLQNPAFWTKMGVVPVAALLTLWFQTTMRRNIVAWDQPRGGPAAVKAASVGFIFLWMVIMALGRWIAYVPT
ncbi:MAG TPA: DUF6644 family protein [Caulobacteraceae bacterium]|jgi:hypothetical protein